MPPLRHTSRCYYDRHRSGVVETLAARYPSGWSVTVLRCVECGATTWDAGRVEPVQHAVARL